MASESVETKSEAESYLVHTNQRRDAGRRQKRMSCPGLNSSMTLDVKFLQSLTTAGIQHLRVAVPDYRPPTVEQMQHITDFISIDSL